MRPVPSVLIGLGLCAGIALSGCAERSAPRGLLLVTIDTCRADRIGAYDPRATWTPTIDDLAARGAVFEQALAPAPITLPSHCSILTGLYPDRHGVRDNGAGRLPEGAETIAEILAERGWRTAAFLAAVPLERRYGTAQGFELYDDEFIDAEAAGDLLNRLYRDQRNATEVTAAALPWLREAAAGRDPWFAWVHYFDPHSPPELPAHLEAQFRDSPYDGEVAWVDEQIGVLLDGLGTAVGNALVVVTADHGESLDEHDESSHGWFVYDATIRVPWVMAGPGVPAGRRVAEPVSLVQALPTLLELLGVDAPEGLDGASAAPMLDGGTPATETVLYAESLFPRLNFGWSGSRSVRRGSWKYIEAPVPELYDLATDPDELHDVAAMHPEVVADLRAELAEFLDRGGELEAVALDIDDETRDRLDALGYVGGEGTAPDDDLWDFGARDPKETIAAYHELQRLPQVILGSPREEERAFVDSLLAFDPRNVAILERVLRLRQRGEDPEGVEETARRIVAVEADHVEAWVALGGVCSDGGDAEGALQAYAEAVRLEPEDAAIATNRALALAAAGRSPEALREFDRALDLDPALVAAVTGKAQELGRAGRSAEAVRTLEAGLAAAGDHVDLLNNLAWLLANESIDPARAYELATRARELAPEDPAVLDTFGWAAIRAGRPAEAVDPLRLAWQVTGDAEVRAHLGVALAESGRAEEGATHVRAAIAERSALARTPEMAKWSR